MKTEISAGGVLALTAVAGVGLFLFWNRDAIKGAVQAVNPASDQNLAYRAVNAVTQTVTGKPDVSFGSWLYDVTHPNQYDPTAPVSVPNAGYKVWDSILARKAREAAAGGLNDAGFVEALGADGKKELLPPQNRAVWLVVAGVSLALYANNRRRSGAASRRRRRIGK